MAAFQAALQQERYEKAIRRFWSYVRKGPASECWEWLSAKRGGYGRFSLGDHLVAAHRLAYELLFGPIPEGMCLDHLCRNHGCVNPYHLQPVPPRTNTLRGVGPTAVNTQKAHCPKGHPYDTTNTGYTNGGKSRRCLACKRESDERRNHRLAAMRADS